MGGFFAGMLLVALIDKLVPYQGNPHEVKKVEEMNQYPQSARSKNLLPLPGLWFLSHWMGSFLRLKNIIKNILRFMDSYSVWLSWHFACSCFSERGKKLLYDYVIYSVHFSASLIDLFMFVKQISYFMLIYTTPLKHFFVVVDHMLILQP
ncbi:hypothetical protein HNR44_001791 [Geomicrobium halophilum]|uniref:Uncharacterized protein n=1 Tax=Geomicrobium halophilum TaxID=549000 RepID=A0A841PYN7_9BACL|nr:hypothetical protein [Geomicrobium halophilum]